MYPPDPWATVSKEAVDLINRLLQVSRKSRFRTSQALNHTWLGDKTLWEDLCQLEGCMGMRYLTHETEDAFWLSHGAKSHPLAKAEAEKRKQIRLEQQQEQQQIRPNQRVNFVEPDQISNSSKISNGSSKSVDSPGVFSEEAKHTEPNGSIGAERNGGTPTNQKDRKDYLSMTDDDILKAQQHAERVGYKVTTV